MSYLQLLLQAGREESPVATTPPFQPPIFDAPLLEETTLAPRGGVKLEDVLRNPSSQWGIGPWVRNRVAGQWIRSRYREAPVFYTTILVADGPSGAKWSE